MKLRRFEKIGAVFTEDLTNEAYLRKIGAIFDNSSIVSGRGKKVFKIDSPTDADNGSLGNIPLGKEISPTKFSYCIWFKFTGDITSDHYPLHFNPWTNSVGNLDITASKAIKARAFDSAGVVQQTSVYDISSLWGEWIHVVVTGEVGSSLKLYINGELARSISWTWTPNSTNPNSVDIERTANRGLQVFYASDLLVFPYVLTAEDVSALYNGSVFDYEKHLVSKWDMSEPYVKDTGWKQNENDGTPTSIDTSNIKTMGAGKNAIYFDGAYDYIDVGTGLDLANKSFTITTEVKVSDFTNNIVSFSSGTPETNKGLHTQFRNDNSIRFGFYNNDLTSDTGITTTNPSWLCCTFDSSSKNRRIIYNEDNVKEATSSSNFIGSGNTSIGNLFLTSGFYFNGYLSKIKVFEEAITPLASRELNKNKERGL